MGIRKTIAAVIAAAMVLSMTACANSEKPNNEGGVTNSNSSSTNKIFGIEDDVPVPPKQTSMWDVIPEIPVTDASAFKYEYDSERGGMVVTDYLKESPKVRIPDILEGEPVVAVNLSKCSKEITQLVMPNSVRTFSLSDEIRHALQHVNIPDSMDVIGYSKFRSYSELTNVYIPNSITRIADGEHSIDNKGGIPGSNRSDSAVFDRCEKLTTVAYNGKTYDYEHIGLLYDAINLGDSGMLIEDGTLKDVSRELTEVAIPDSVTVIYFEAFENCTGLTSIVIPNSVTEIGDGTFKDCINLTNICVDESNPVFFTYDRLLCKREENKSGISIWACPRDMSGSIQISDNVDEIEHYAFKDCINLSSITIPDSVTSINTEAFGNCTGLTSIMIPNGVTEINYNTFSGCTSLTSIIIPQNITKINENAFEGCTALTDIIISDSVTYIGSYAFKDCTSLKSITIPDSVTLIAYDTIHNKHAFDGCTSLMSVTYKGVTYDCNHIFSSMFPDDDGYLYGAINGK